MTSRFDPLPDLYDDFTATPFRRFLETPSVLDVVGDLRGAAVLDLGCGSGAYTRLVRRNGAARATGLDVSPGMIGHARARETAAPLGIDYILGGELPDELAGTFDLVLPENGGRRIADRRASKDRTVGDRGLDGTPIPLRASRLQQTARGASRRAALPPRPPHTRGPTRVSTVCGQQTPHTGDTAVRISVRTTGSVAAVAPRQWDALVGPDNFHNSHRRLRALELTHGDTAVVTASGDGRLLGALPTWPGERDAPLFRLPDLFPGPAGSWPDGYLWLGARHSVYNELLCLRGPLRTPTLTALMRGALATARSRGAAGLVLPYPTGRDAAEPARTHPRARVLLHDADANLPVPEGGFATHLARMRHGDRTRRRAELRACERAGTAVRRLPLTEEAIPVART
ncbi:bifunctional class I SAM-dependent methyltransferase/GNAT family N-acetyltransferase [Streptomyces sp. NPDC048717]|uniref:class I SAM-dependent methyltransferase n=1 Tax=Streptomyces sp. NPDC048717 TaxID=3154928 RepID=UPI00343A4DF2